MAYDLPSLLDDAKLAESEAFRRLVAIEDLTDWDETFGAWLRAVRRLQRATAAAAGKAAGAAAGLVPGFPGEVLS
jgi:hypothetical protein